MNNTAVSIEEATTSPKPSASSNDLGKFEPDQFKWLSALASQNLRRSHLYIESQEARESPDKRGYFRFISLPFTTEQLEALQRHANALITEEGKRQEREQAEALKKAQPWWKKAWRAWVQIYYFCIGATAMFVAGGLMWGGIQFVVNEGLSLLRTMVLWWPSL